MLPKKKKAPPDPGPWCKARKRCLQNVAKKACHHSDSVLSAAKTCEKGNAMVAVKPESVSPQCPLVPTHKDSTCQPRDAIAPLISRDRRCPLNLSRTGMEAAIAKFQRDCVQVWAEPQFYPSPNPLHYISRVQLIGAPPTSSIGSLLPHPVFRFCHAH